LWPSRLVQNIKFVRRGGIYPARGVHAAASRADMESAPTGADINWGVTRLSARFPLLRRAGVYARRTLAISKSERPRRRRVRRDGGIPPYGRPGGCGHPGWSKT